MYKKQDNYILHYFDEIKNTFKSSVYTYILWFNSKHELIDIRNQLSEMGFSVEKNSDVFSYFKKKYS